MASYIGIDLGTTNSVVATIDPTGRPVIVHNKEGSNITPSVVSKLATDRFDIGETARKSLGQSNTKGAFKRDIGTGKSYDLDGTKMTPLELSALVLKKLGSDAEDRLGKLSDVVVTIPANFANEAREATLKAAKQAGLNVKHIINEPTAAALYFAHNIGLDLEGNYAVYDLGGGTFDVTVLSIQGRDVDVLATEGVSKLGGENFDKELQKLVFDKYKAECGEFPDPDDYSLSNAEEDKKSLSKRAEIKVRVRSDAGSANFSVTRDEFDAAISNYISQSEILCENVLDEANINVKDLNGVFLVGGSTRVPAIKQSIKKIFKSEPISFANPDEVVALGAALYAAYKSDGKELNDVQKNSIDKLNISEITSKYFGTIVAGIDFKKETLMLQNSVIIKKGTKIPCEETISVFTIRENQTEISCKVTEAGTEEIDPKFVNIIGEGQFIVPEGRPEGQEILVTYSYDENQVMHCAFMDVGSNRKIEMDFKLAKEAKDEVDISKFIVE